jgi:catechol 2,3-dioxygenase-like lactoylglutathione lyase family enzyme
MKINYVIIFVSNMKLSIEFYKNILRMKLKFETTHWSEFEGEGARVALHKSDIKNTLDESSRKLIAGSCRPGFSVFNLDEFHSRMLNNKVTCVKEPKEEFGAKTAQYLDPDGLVITVSEQRLTR